MTWIKRYLKKTRWRLFPNCSKLHDYVHWHYSIDYCVRLFLSMRIYVKICLIAHWNYFCKFLWGITLIRGELQIDAKIPIVEFLRVWHLWIYLQPKIVFIFASILYMKSVSLLLIQNCFIFVNVSQKSPFSHRYRCSHHIYSHLRPRETQQNCQQDIQHFVPSKLWFQDY